MKPNLFSKKSTIWNPSDFEFLKLLKPNKKHCGHSPPRAVILHLFDFVIDARIDGILARNHQVCGSSLKIERYFGPIEDEFFIEEEQESGALSERNKNLAKASNAYFTIRSFSQPSLAVDRSKIILSNIQENVNIQQLDFYIQLITQQNRADINEINWSLEKKGKLIIDFKTEIDINKILAEFNNSNLNNINGKPIQIETVNKTKTLVVLVKSAMKVCEILNLRK